VKTHRRMGWLRVTIMLVSVSQRWRCFITVLVGKVGWRPDRLRGLRYGTVE